MGLVNSALQIGRSALLTYQSALQVVGNNISNAGSPDYTRQSPGLSTLSGTGLPEGMRPGSGVALTSLQRHLDESLENRLRVQIGDSESAAIQQRAMGLVESLIDPLTGLGVETRLNEFFNSLDQLQNAPTDAASRELAVAAGVSLADTLRQLRSELIGLTSSFNEQITALVEQANERSGQVADLNTEIVTAEASGGPASALRDQRDASLRQLSELVQVSVRPQSNGSVTVYVGNEVLVEGATSRGLTVTSDFDGEFRRDDIAFADNNARVDVRGGQVAGLMTARDQGAAGRVADFDRLAAGLIHEVNRVHADGQGLGGFATLTAERAVDDPTAALNAAGLPFAPDNGSFYIAVTNASSGATTGYQIQVDLDGVGDDTTLESLATEINDTVTGVTASIGIDNRLTLTADGGVTFSFGHDGSAQRRDTSGALAALGFNTFFSGSSAADISVNQVVSGDPSMLAAAAVNLSGDGSNAGRISLVAQLPTDLFSGASITSQYESIVSDVAVTAARARDDAEATASVLSSLQAQKENISGVSLDEEAVELLKFERAFQGAARFVNVVDRLSQEIISLVS